MKFQFSAGGVVLKDDKVLVAQHSQHHGWVFPKGLIEGRVRGEKKSAFAKGYGETKEETALREVKEETGVSAKIMKQLTPVEYWFKFENETIKKKVYYFLMQFVSQDEKHDMEMEKVEWLPIEDVEKRLTYPSDRKVWKEAKEKIRNPNIEIRNKSK